MCMLPCLVFASSELNFYGGQIGSGAFGTVKKALLFGQEVRPSHFAFVFAFSLRDERGLLLL